MKTITHTIICKNFSEALDMLRSARAFGLHAAYLPLGGIDAHRDDPVVHRVPVIGDPKTVKEFCNTPYGA